MEVHLLQPVDSLGQQVWLYGGQVVPRYVQSLQIDGCCCYVPEDGLNLLSSQVGVPEVHLLQPVDGPGQQVRLYEGQVVHP